MDIGVFALLDELKKPMSFGLAASKRRTESVKSKVADYFHNLGYNIDVYGDRGSVLL